MYGGAGVGGGVMVGRVGEGGGGTFRPRVRDHLERKLIPLTLGRS